LNDSELVQGLRRQDPAAMQWLCDCYLPSLWRFVYTRVGGDAHLAEDITSETVLAMLTLLRTGEAGEASQAEIENLAGWLRTVAQRRIADHFRAVSRVQHLLERGGGTERSEVNPAAQLEIEENRAAVRQAMDELCDQHRLALEWKYLDHLSVREIAARWGITEKSVESILFRARRELRERLENDQQAEPSPQGRLPKEKDSDVPSATDDDAPCHPAHQERASEQAAQGIAKE
jgi:RNA polymerase sigma factor (sigma-70 family)